MARTKRRKSYISVAASLEDIIKALNKEDLALLNEIVDYSRSWCEAQDPSIRLSDVYRERAAIVELGEWAWSHIVDSNLDRH